MFCGIANAQKLDKIQERAVRFVFKDMTSRYEITSDLLYHSSPPEPQTAAPMSVTWASHIATNMITGC